MYLKQSGLDDQIVFTLTYKGYNVYIHFKHRALTNLSFN